MHLRIRPAEPDDLDQLGPIEIAAGRQFAAIGMPEIADDPPLPRPGAGPPPGLGGGRR